MPALIAPSLNVATFAPTLARFDQLAPPSVLRCSMKPVSLLDRSAQLSVTALGAPLATSEPGATGTATSVAISFTDAGEPGVNDTASYIVKMGNTIVLNT